MIRDKPVRFCDKLLPDQPINNLYYTGSERLYHEALYGLLTQASGVCSPFEEFDLELTDVVSVEEMASNPLMLRFLELLVRLSGARRVLEIGAFIGISTMTLARAMPSDGRVITIEKFDRFAEVCRKNFARNGLTDRIELHQGDARQVIPRLGGDPPFDLVFLDGDKERYADYFLAVEPLVRPGGLIVIDDIIFQGDALNEPPTTAKGSGVVRFMELASRKNDWLRCALPVSDGIMLMVKP